LLRLNAAFATARADERGAIEAEATALFGSDRRFIVYGSLGPGRANHHHLAALHGGWSEGWVTGDRMAVGWGAAHGHPALRWRASGPRVEAWLFSSDDLPAHWARLDALEGSEYRRTLAPFHATDGVPSVGYLYTAAVGG
jgi:gamma-glutamylcyclotransferase (GGCT)/AIG2-like uncharacterized protein YtfP